MRLSRAVSWAGVSKMAPSANSSYRLLTHGQYATLTVLKTHCPVIKTVFFLLHLVKAFRALHAFYVLAVGRQRNKLL